MSELVVLRHGETTWSRTGRHTGTTEVPLTANGEAQALALGSALRGREFGLELSSPRTRARRTAELAGFGAAEVDADLAEWDYGAHEGRTTADISAELGHPWSLFDDGVPAGESLQDVAQRVGRVLARAQPVLTDGQDVLLVAHGHVLRVLTACWLGLPPRAGTLLALDAGTVSHLGFEHGTPVLTGWNHRPDGADPAR